MQRDMDLVRKILEVTADSRMPVNANVFTDDRYDHDLVGYHIKIMEQAGLIEAMIVGADGCPYVHCEVIDLTWQGHEFLANVKDSKLWNRIKSTVAIKAGDASFSVISKLASDMTSQLLLG